MMGLQRIIFFILYFSLIVQPVFSQQRQTFENASWQQRDSMITTLYQGGALQVVSAMIEDAYTAEKSKDTLSEAFAVFSLWQGIRTLTEQKLDEAERYLMESINTFKKLPNRESGRYLDALLNMADLQSQLQNGEEMLRYKNESLAEMEQDPEGQEQLYHTTLMESLEAAISYGLYDQAQEYGRKALRFAQEKFTNQSNEYLQSLMAVGRIYLAQGEERRAANLILQAYELAKKNLAAGDLNRVYYGTNAVSILKTLGRYSAAEMTYQEIIQFFEENSQFKGEKIYPAVLDDLGTFYEELGDLNKAYEYYEKANVLFALRLDRSDPLYIKSQLNVGNILRKQEKYTEAEVYYRDALQHSLNLYGEKNWSEATLRDNLGSIYYELGQFDQALAERLQVKEIAEFVWGPNHQEFAYALLNLGKTYERLGNIEEARENLEIAFTKFNQLFGKTHYRVYESAKELAAFYEEVDPASALEKYEVAGEFINYYMEDILPLFAGSDRKEFINDFNQLISRYASFTLKNQDQLAAAVPALHNLLLIYKRDIQTPDLATSSAYFIRPSSELRKAYGEWQTVRQKVVTAQSRTVAEQKESDLQLQKLIEQIQSIRKSILPAFKSGSFDHPENIDFSQIKSKIDANDAIVDFYEVLLYNEASESYQANDYYLVFITPGRSATTKLIQIQLNRNILQTEQLKNQSAYYEQIWKPLERDIAKNDRIHICPDGFLNKVSFYALPTSTAQFLAEDHEIILYNTLNNILSIKDQTSAEKILMMGSPDFYANDADTSDIPSLALKINPVEIGPDATRKDYPISQSSSSTSEIGDLSTFLTKKKKQVTLKNGKAANKFNLHQQLAEDQWSVVHLSIPIFAIQTSDSTGGLNTVSPFQCGLALAGSQTSWRADTLSEEIQDDGLLTAEEIYNLQLNGTELMILPHIVVTPTTPGNALFNIKKAFIDSGVHKLIYTLWPIAETDRTAFLDLFYKNLLKSGSIDQSFAKTQTKFRKKGDVRIWGGIVLSN